MTFEEYKSQKLSNPEVLDAYNSIGKQADAMRVIFAMGLCLNRASDKLPPAAAKLVKKTNRLLAKEAAAMIWDTI